MSQLIVLRDINGLLSFYCFENSASSRSHLTPDFSLLQEITLASGGASVLASRSSGIATVPGGEFRANSRKTFFHSSTLNSKTLNPTRQLTSIFSSDFSTIFN